MGRLLEGLQLPLPTRTEQLLATSNIDCEGLGEEDILVPDHVLAALVKLAAQDIAWKQKTERFEAQKQKKKKTKKSVTDHERTLDEVTLTQLIYKNAELRWDQILTCGKENLGLDEKLFNGWLAHDGLLLRWLVMKTCKLSPEQAGQLVISAVEKKNYVTFNDLLEMCEVKVKSGYDTAAWEKANRVYSNELRCLANERNTNFRLSMYELSDEFINTVTTVAERQAIFRSAYRYVLSPHFLYRITFASEPIDLFTVSLDGLVLLQLSLLPREKNRMVDPHLYFKFEKGKKLASMLSLTHLQVQCRMVGIENSQEFIELLYQGSSARVGNEVMLEELNAIRATREGTLGISLQHTVEKSAVVKKQKHEKRATIRPRNPAKAW